MCLDYITIQLLSIDIMQFNLFDHSKNKNNKIKTFRNTYIHV